MSSVSEPCVDGKELRFLSLLRTLWMDQLVTSAVYVHFAYDRPWSFPQMPSCKNVEQ